MRLTEVIAVAAGANFTIALSLDGKIACFGASGHGQCDLPEQLQALILQDEEPEEPEALSSPSLSPVAADIDPDLADVDPFPEPPVEEDVFSAEADPQLGMASTMDSFAESFTTMDTSASEHQEAEPPQQNPEEQAQARIQALHLQIADAWEQATAMAKRFEDNVRGLAAGSFHCCVILADGCPVFFGDDSANQCTVPDGLSPLMQQLSSDELPLALLDLDTSKPAILFPPAPETAEDTVADVASS